MRQNADNADIICVNKCVYIYISYCALRISFGVGGPLSDPIFLKQSLVRRALLEIMYEEILAETDPTPNRF